MFEIKVIVELWKRLTFLSFIILACFVDNNSAYNPSQNGYMYNNIYPNQQQMASQLPAFQNYQQNPQIYSQMPSNSNLNQLRRNGNFMNHQSQMNMQQSYPFSNRLLQSSSFGNQFNNMIGNNQKMSHAFSNSQNNDNQQFNSRKILRPTSRRQEIIDQPRNFGSTNCGILKPKLTNYVANGESTRHQEWPWHVQLTILANNLSESETYCGGTLVSRNFILTAAHCYDELSPSKRAKNTVITMKGLDHPSQTKPIRKRNKSKQKKQEALTLKAKNVYIFPDYIQAMSEQEANDKNQMPGPRHDLALIEFEIEDEEIIDKLMPICLPSENYQLNLNSKCKIMGHGFMNANDEDNFIMPNILQMADVFVSSNVACKNDVDSDSIKAKINSDTICIRGPIHPCVGDSGGPLLCKGKSEYDISGEIDHDENDDEFEMQEIANKWYLMGVTSFAVSTDENDKCGQFKSAVFGKVSNYVNWINKMVGGSN